MDDGRMEPRAERQHGVVSCAQARSAGMSESAIRHRRRRGRWVDVGPGVYRVVGARETPRQRAMTATLAAGPDAVVSHTTAAALLGVPGFGVDPVTITVPRSRRSIAGVRIEQTLALPAHHRRMVDGIPCTSVPRTIFDLCGDVHARRAERAMDTALARGLVTIPALWRVLDDLAVQGRAGTVLLRALLTERGPRSVPPESELEARFVELVAAHVLPPPELQVDLGDADAWIGRVDFVWRDARLVVEVDGAVFHDALTDRRNDDARDARLHAAGWSVLRFRWADVVDRPADVAAQVRSLLSSHDFRGAWPSSERR